MSRKRVAVAVAAVTLAAGGLGLGLGLSLGGSPEAGPQALARAGAKATYAYYETVARRYSGDNVGGQAMMGGAGGGASMMGVNGYAWMMGETGAPGWMMGGSLPPAMMGAGHGPGTVNGPGTVMGRLFAAAPGPRVSAARATELGNEVPSGATVDRGANRISFSGPSVELAVVASPSMRAEDFRTAGLTDPTVVVPVGAHVRVELVNADADMAHGLVIAGPGADASPMPMMTARPAFSGASLWFLGDPTTAGMHAGTLSFTASTAGTYSYFCPVPGHAQEGMAGTFIVKAAS